MSKLRLGWIGRFIGAMKHEYDQEAECMEELYEEREEALEDAESCDETFKHNGAALCAYNELEDDQIFAERKVDCHRKHSLFRKALRGE